MGQDQGHLLGQRYRLVSVVGRGGMGTVWRAHDEVLHRDVAVKEVLCPPGLSEAEQQIVYERTFREARASARLDHPGVVTLHDVVEESGRPWIVMQLIQARSLQQIIEEDGPLPPGPAAGVGHQTLAALRHAHAAGILHRDVKPSNVLVTEDGRAVLTDFGIAQAEGDTTLTQTGLVMGSPAYIPPERAHGERATPASDLWALGATLYAAVEGRPPYEREDAMASLAAALSEPVPPPRHAGPLRPVLDGLLVRDPAHRITADQALSMLDEVAKAPDGRAPVRPAGGDAVLGRPPGPPNEPPFGDPAEPPNGPGTGPPNGPPNEPRTGPPNVPPSDPSDARTDVDQTVFDPSVFEAATHVDRTEHTPPPVYHPGSPPADPQVRTYVETNWVPPQYAPWNAGAAQAPARRRERAKTTAVIVVATVLVVAALVSGALILRSRTTASGRTSGDEKTVSQNGDTGGAGASQTAGGGAPDGGAPDGYKTVTEDGFSVAIPSGWTRRTAGNSVFWDSPGKTTFLQIDQTTWTGTPSQEAYKSDGNAPSSPSFPGYALTAISGVEYQGTNAADWEFTFDDARGRGTVRAKDRFVRLGGRAYAIYFRALDDDWSSSQPRLETFYRTFKAK